MPLHAFAGAQSNTWGLALTSSDTDVVVVNEFPFLPTAYPIVFRLAVESGVVISASATSEYALSFAGLHADTLVFFDNFGVIQGAGGTGGSGGHVVDTHDDGVGGVWWIRFYSGGGGGGAGKIVGPGGGIYNSPAEQTETVGTDGTIGSYPGTPAAGGPEGTTYANQGTGLPPDFNPDLLVAGGSATGGGDALFAPCDLRITNSSGYILGGGGGGAPGRVDVGAPFRPDLWTMYLPGAGGDPGDEGEEASPGAGKNGAGGYAIKHTGVAPTFPGGGGTSPNVEGTIGA